MLHLLCKYFYINTYVRICATCVGYIYVQNVLDRILFVTFISLSRVLQCDRVLKFIFKLYIFYNLQNWQLDTKFEEINQLKTFQMVAIYNYCNALCMSSWVLLVGSRVRSKLWYRAYSKTAWDYSGCCAVVL